ncbi:MAG: 50S ribosomal protein L34 [Elusimicrobia bacterium]|nr:50S ribosomal protein L34 [Elusimicrobiota bacterium]
MSQTYKPHKLKKKRRMGFLAKMKTKSGRRIINSRRSKGRKRLACE